MTVKCRDCGKEVAITAEFCPYCGAKNPALTAEEHYNNEKNMLKYPIIYAIIIFAIPLLAYIGYLIGYALSY